MGETANAVNQSKLKSELDLRSLTYFNGFGKHPSGEWPAEPSFLVLGISLEASKVLGKKYDQNAVVWCGLDAIPELVLLK